MSYLPQDYRNLDRRQKSFWSFEHSRAGPLHDLDLAAASQEEARLSAVTELVKVLNARKLWRHCDWAAVGGRYELRTPTEQT